MDSDFGFFSKKVDQSLDVSILEEPAKSLLGRIRTQIDNEYNDVSVDIRKHRIVFGRMGSLRWFLDVLPTNDGLILSMPSREAHHNVKKVKIRTDSELHSAILDIDGAYRSV